MNSVLSDELNMEEYIDNTVQEMTDCVVNNVIGAFEKAASKVLMIQKRT